MSAVRLTIDGREVEAPAGQSLLEACRAAGATVPSLCHHKHLLPYGACRVCLVEVEKGGRSRITTSCNFVVQDGIAVTTDSEAIRRHRRMVLELLLGLAPDAQRVRALARTAGVEESRFPSREAPGGRERCILCGLCARVCDEVVEASAIGFSGRGDRRGLDVPYREAAATSCIACGACAAVCPTGAIDLEPIRVAQLKERSGPERSCRYALMGLMPGALCPNDYECRRCEVDQRFVEACRPDHPVFAARGWITPRDWEE